MLTLLRAMFGSSPWHLNESRLSDRQLRGSATAVTSLPPGLPVRLVAAILSVACLLSLVSQQPHKQNEAGTNSFQSKVSSVASRGSAVTGA